MDDSELKVRITGIIIGVFLFAMIPLLELCTLRPDVFTPSGWATYWPTILMIVGVMAPVFGIMGGAIAATIHNKRQIP